MLYYLPQVTNPTQRDLAPLSYALEGKPRAAQVTRGPLDMPAGVVVSDPRSPGADRLGHYPDRQTWRKLPAGSDDARSICVGYWNDARPGPEHLARRTQHPGHLVELADGNQWHCPAAVRFESEETPPQSTLPHAVDIDESGAWTTGEILSDFQHLWEVAARWQTFYASLHGAADDGELETDLELVEIFDDALACLAINYRVSKIEVAMLGLFTEWTAARVLNSVIDEPGLTAILEKKTAD